MSILFGATLATLVLALVSYTVYRRRARRRPRGPLRGWAIPDENDGTLRPILFERVDLDDLDGSGTGE